MGVSGGRKSYHIIMAVHIKDIDQTQADWNEGTLTDVEADAGGYLRLPWDVTSGTRLSPQLDLSAVGMVESSSVSWNGGYNGIEYGYDTDDLTYYINQWGGVSNVGEIDLTGTQFTKWDGTVCDITPINSGVALQDGSTVEGYLMYSAESVFTRFSANPPNLYNCDHIIGVRYNAGQWEYDNNTAWFPFTPVSSDCLIAKVGWGVSYLSKLAGSDITIETRVSTDNGATWTAWKTCTNGGAIPDLPYGTDVSNGLLECRQTLSTQDPSATPQLDSLTLEVNSQKLHMDTLTPAITDTVLDMDVSTQTTISPSISTSYELDSLVTTIKALQSGAWADKPHPNIYVKKNGRWRSVKLKSKQEDGSWR